MTWKLVQILNSGRKGIRMEPSDRPKYKDIIDWYVYFNKEDVKRAKPLRFYFKGHPLYDWWDTSLVLSSWIDLKTNLLYIETENTIYVFEEIERS